MSLAPDNVDVLRHGWEDTVSALAPTSPDLGSLLEERLEQAVRENRLDESSLLGIVHELSATVAATDDAETARRFDRGLQRAVYEYL
ncbi:MAG: hypothetical protein ABR498_05415, partial [Candidatus Dormibacteria bacterium]